MSSMWIHMRYNNNIRVETLQLTNVYNKTVNLTVKKNFALYHK